MQKAVAKNLRDLCLTFQLDNALARIEFADIIKVALQAWRACENHERTSFDNRTVWAKFLDPLFIERHFPDRVKLQVVPELVRIYMSYLDNIKSPRIYFMYWEKLLKLESISCLKTEIIYQMHLLRS